MTALVIVTGGSTGIGAAVLGAAPDSARRLDVSRSGPGRDDVDHLAADLADPTGWATVGTALAERIAAHDGDRVTVVHSAGTLDPIGYAGEVDADAYASLVLLDAAAPQVLGHHVLTALRTHPATRRELVLLSSGAARNVRAGWAAYGAAKAAVDQWVRAVALEQADRGGVRVLAVAPGVVETRMHEQIRATADRDLPTAPRFRELHERGQLAAPEDAARRLWRLLDDADADPDLGPVVDLRDRP